MSKKRSVKAVFFCSAAWAGLIAGVPVMAQDQTNDVAEAAPDNDADEGIIVTGPVPVDIVSADTLRSGGATELSQALAVSMPSLNFPPVLPASAFTATLRGFTYRGLPPSEVLILVNGKRWRPTSPASLSTFFDLNSLPSTAIDHMEVLRGGAFARSSEI